MHLIVEATKQSFTHRPTLWADPDALGDDYKNALTDERLNALASNIDMSQAKQWPFNAEPGDTVWMAARDKKGQLVSFIQSVYWEFGSGILMSEGGFVWNNRGLSFSLNSNDANALKAHKKPAHTLNPALAKFDDGRRLAYGTMGGEGQPQTQAMIFTRHVLYGQDLQTAVTAPRWLLGRTWGAETTNLRIENRFPGALLKKLRAAGHDVETVGPFEEFMGHAGALVHHPSGLIEGAADPRSDGIVAGF